MNKDFYYDIRSISQLLCNLVQLSRALFWRGLPLLTQLASSSDDLLVGMLKGIWPGRWAMSRSWLSIPLVLVRVKTGIPLEAAGFLALQSCC
jgi:hypothetical protein